MKKFTLFLLLCIIYFSIFSQNTYQEALIMSEQYWGSIPDSVKYAKGSGYKQYLRTKSWVESRIGSDGTMNAYVNAMRNANSVKSSTNSWEYTGPYEIPGGTQARYQSSKGWIWSCQVNPVNHNEIYIGAHHGGVWKTTDGGVNWYPLCDEYPLIGGIISLAIDWDAGLNGEDIIYAASTASDDTYWGYSTGVFKSVDGGSSWSDINNGDLADLYPRFCFKYTARKIIIHPNNSDIIYYLTYDNIYKSTNAGTTWSNIKNDTFSWSGSEYGWYDIEIAISGLNETIFVSGHKVIKSTDGGQNWTDITTAVMGINQCVRCEIAVNNDVYPGWVYFLINYAISDYSYYKISKYDIITNTYSILDDLGLNAISGANKHKMECEISPTRYLTNGGTNEPFLYLAGLQVYDYNFYRASGTKEVEISKSYQSSTTFNLNGPGNWVHDDIRCMQILEDSGTDRIFIGNDGGFSTALSNSFGTTCGSYLCWSNLSGGQNGLHCSEFYGVSTLNSPTEKLIGGLQDCGVFVYNPYNTEEWIHSSSGDGSKTILINPDYPNICFIGDFYNIDGRLLKSTNGGEEFNQFANILYNHPNSPLEYKPDDAEVLYLGTGEQRGGTAGCNLLRFNNTYTSSAYDNITPTLDGEKSITAIGTCESNPDVLYTACAKYYAWSGEDPINYEKCIWRTENSTALSPTWIDISENLIGLQSGYVLDIEVDSYNEDVIYVAFAFTEQGAKVCKGAWNKITQTMTWSDFSNGLTSNMPVNEIAFDKTNYILYAATDVGIYYCDPNITPIIWNLYNNGLPKKMINDIGINSSINKIYAATYGRGMWENDLICNNQGNDVTIITNTTWDEKYITGNLVLQNNATLTVNNVLGLSDDLNIVINAGCTLVLNGILESNCDGTGYWNGSITVKDGGEFKVNNGASLNLRDVGYIQIEEDGLFNYCGGELILYDTDTYIDIEGNLEIADNATFTFTGDGYIKFSKPGNDSETQDNIIAGTNASFVLEGTGKNDKKMEIQQSTVHFPELAELRFEDCKIEMGAGSTGLGARM